MKLRAISSGKVHVIDDRRDLIRAGGEGGVYTLRDEPSLVAKIYHEPGDRRPKLEAMLRNPPSDDATAGHKSIAWPTDILVDAGNAKKFAGYLMPKVERASGFHEFSNPSRREKQHPNFGFRHLHIVASNAASAFWALHQKGYVIGDVNEGNLLIRDDGLATVVDTDSFQVRIPDGTVYRCKVGREEFTPPELQSAKSLGDHDREVVHDLFGLGVLLFQLLMQGFHPYSGTPTFKGEGWQLGQRIADGNFPWDGSSKPFKVPPLAPRLDILDPRLQRLFIEAFGRDRRRPNASTWKRELDAAIERLRPCDRVKLHAYGKHLSSCPWCERDSQFANTPKKSTPSLPSQVSVSVPRLPPRPTLRTPPTFLNATPVPRPFVPPAEITAGTWRVQTEDAVMQALSAFASADQIYELHPDGRCDARGMLNIMGNQCQFTAQGRWSYDTFQKLLSIDGSIQVSGTNFTRPWMNLLAHAMPPQPLTARMSVINASPGRVTMRDHSNNTTFLFERLPGRIGVS